MNTRAFALIGVIFVITPSVVMAQSKINSEADQSQEILDDSNQTEVDFENITPEIDFEEKTAKGKEKLRTLELYDSENNCRTVKKETTSVRDIGSTTTNCSWSFESRF